MEAVETRDRRIESVPETCGLLKLSRAKVYDLMDEGKLQRVKLGHRTFITTASIEALLDAAFAGGERDRDGASDEDELAASLD
jgi:hypothetical protein